MNSLGIAAGLATAVLWTATAVCFEVAGRRIGSLLVNLLRLGIAQVLFVGLSLWRHGTWIAPDLAWTDWRDLLLSGLIGFVVADLMLFEAFVLIGARLSMLIYASVPTITAVLGFVCLGERIGRLAIFGMLVTASGIALAVLGKRSQEAIATKRRLGILLAFGGSVGQAIGLLLGKHGATHLDAFAATEIRVVAGLLGFLLIAITAGRLGQLPAILRVAWGTAPAADRQSTSATRGALIALTAGGVLGPFLGVSLGLLTTQLLPTGVASTLMSIVPALLVPVSAVVFKERVSPTEVGGTVIALLGVALLTR